MKIINVIIFLTGALSILGAVNFYICIRGWQAIPKDSFIRIPYLAVFVFVALSYIAGRVLERYSVCAFSDLLIWIGSIWFGMMLYLFLGAVACDLLRLVNWIAHVVPVPSARYDRIKQITAVAIASASALVVLGGYVNSLYPRLTRLSIDIPKKAAGRTCFDIALVTDIHLGTIISNSRLRKMVDMVNVIRPDIVLLAGDIVDEDLAPVIENNLGGLLTGLRSSYGTYAVTGNHEYIGGVEEACAYLSANGVRMLRDGALTIGGVCLIGREDRSKKQFTGVDRKPLDVIMKGVDRSLPLILMDHQPFRLSDAVGQGVDLQLSGHTHNGQLWPGSVITGLVYEVSWGLKRIGRTHVYVSSGFGTWGPPSRVGTIPEVVHIKLRFAEGNKGG
jgi:predicted MPP superfamily phosphohydrolase